MDQGRKVGGGRRVAVRVWMCGRPRASPNSLFCIGNFLSYGDEPEVLGGKVVRILKMLRKGASMLPLTLLRHRLLLSSLCERKGHSGIT